MATFRTPQIIQLPPEAIARASAFADTVIDTVNYRDSNQSRKQKIHDDHFVSKLGEEAVRLVFEARNCIVEGPDYTIYSGKEKSWVTDLKINASGSRSQNPAAFCRKSLRSFLDVSGFTQTP